ncbi:MAG: hypothetical protein A3A94_02625 [Candidatus Portnoybacteria bacterium RIFCSPLOWO2_01_FULL_43_11]|uniref:Uncharacterized protein n=3 Tax=Candidatus Portnoyibacteriota TaxID=1817913 RepID=A0A1G2FBP3_9BACT|nr:MAG: hypothetical protein A2815_00675 [Candidatus Portnoybacteria bacterium RIFCSPHIGHO2_01_FULL_40_12b]OGZ38694.1 MAG: hypothetical protein A3A94_02625 [Candidatus Portnoybacteria bacterium RIFCSPLOWO2_01_FULL_43_11]OGZ41063.1 MAG: hypothetical protein A3I20_01305 [Candidatus Portnoybacteria bacterium RIFCSPLOWO2_02_FULL_40_15]
MKIKIKINKKIILIIGLFIAVFGATIFLVVPILKDLTNIRIGIKEKRTELAGIEDLIVRVNEIKKQGRDIGKELEEVYLALPKEKDIPNLLVYFESLSTANGLILESIDFGEIDDETKRGDKKETEKLLKSREVELTVSGTYNAFKNYLRALEENIRSMNVNSIDFISRELITAADSDFLDFDLKVEVYYQ